MSRRHQHPDIVIGRRNEDFCPDVPFDPKDRGPYSYAVTTRFRPPFLACCSVWLERDLPDYIADMEERGALYVLRPLGRRVAVCELLHYLGEAPEGEEAQAATLKKMASMLAAYAFGDKPPYTRPIPDTGER